MPTAPKLAATPDLLDLLSNPGMVSSLPVEAIPALRGELACLDTMLLARLLSDGEGNEEQTEDRLLDAAEAATKLGTSKDWLYRHLRGLPFVIRIGAKQVRFSSAGIDRYIRQKAGKP